MQSVDVLPDGSVDVLALGAALEAARAETERPSFIRLESITRAMAHRFDAGELSGHAMGNLLIAAMVQADGGRRYQYNPRLTEIMRDIPKGTVYDRNGLPSLRPWDMSVDPLNRPPLRPFGRCDTMTR